MNYPCIHPGLSVPDYQGSGNVQDVRGDGELFGIQRGFRLGFMGGWFEFMTV